jgi:hypothetical protein
MGRAMSSIPVLRAASVVLSAWLLSGCVGEPSVSLYPLNHRAYAAILEARMTGYEERRGTLKIVTQEREVFEGPFSISNVALDGFGAILVSGGGPRGCFLMNGTFTHDFTECGIGEGVANLTGSRGNAIQCEFLDRRPPGHVPEPSGSGTCQFSTGNAYSMIYLRVEH